MTEFRDKYTESYFLGGSSSKGDSSCLSGYREYKKNKHHPRFTTLYNFIQSFTGNMEGKNILEIGFGRGELIPLFLKNRCKHYHGIDCSKVALKIAKKHASDNRVSLEQSAAQDFFNKNSYDLIVMNDVIEHIPVFEMNRVWRNIKKSLKPGGVIIVGTHFYKNPNVADATDKSSGTSGLHCHKQTLETLIRSCINHNLILGAINQKTVALVNKKDLSLFSRQKQEAILSTHQTLLSKSDIDPDVPEKIISEKNAPHTGRLLIGCVTEDNEKYFERTLRMVQSIRWFGGSHAGANIVVCFVESANPGYVKELRKWGVFVRIVDRFSKSHPPSNKLRFFELPETESYDTIMFLDCDTVMVQDPAAYIDGKRFQVKIANGPSVSYKVFRKLFKHYQLSIPEQDFLTSNKKLKTIWYCNTGVLIFPQPLLKAFYPVWKAITEELNKKRHLLPNGSYAFCEQASLTLAFFKHPIPFSELTNKMNCPVREGRMDPVIIHYRNAVTNNGDLKIRKSTGGPVAERMKAFNEKLTDFRKRKESF